MPKLPTPDMTELFSGKEGRPNAEVQLSRRTALMAFTPAIAALVPSEAGAGPISNGPLEHVATTLTELKTAPVSRVTMFFQAVPYLWMKGDFRGQADDMAIVASDHQDLTTGAWVNSAMRGHVGDAQPVIDGLANGQGDSLDLGRQTIDGPLSLPNRNVGLRGRGTQSTILKNGTPAGIALELDARVGSYEMMKFSDFAIESRGSRQGIGVQYGKMPYNLHAEFTGRTIFDNVAIDGFDIAINCPYGSIANVYRDVFIGNTKGVNFGYVFKEKASSGGGRGEAMHAGCKRIDGGRIGQFDKAAIYISNKVTNGGQWVIEGTIFENGSGYGIFVDGLKTLNGGPGMVVSNCWVELVGHSQASLSIDGYSARPKFGHFKDADAVHFTNTPVGSLRLINSNITTSNCDITNIINCEIDAGSTLIHDNARAFTGTPDGIVRSIGGAASSSAVAPCYGMKLPHVAKIAHPRLYVATGDQIFTLMGTAAVPATKAPATLAGLSASLEITLPARAQVFHNVPVTVPGDKYLVIRVVARIVSGSYVAFGLSGTAAIGGEGKISGSMVRCYTKLFRSTATLGGEAIWFFGNPSTPTTLRYVAELLAFDTEQEAVAFANDGPFSASESEEHSALVTSTIEGEAPTVIERLAKLEAQVQALKA